MKVCAKLGGIEGRLHVDQEATFSDPSANAVEVVEVAIVGDR